MKKNLFALLNICTILLSLFLTGCSGKESKITLNSSQPECILSNNNNIVLESYTNESVLDDEIPERSITCWGDSMMQGVTKHIYTLIMVLKTYLTLQLHLLCNILHQSIPTTLV